MVLIACLSAHLYSFRRHKLVFQFSTWKLPPRNFLTVHITNQSNQYKEREVKVLIACLIKHLPQNALGAKNTHYHLPGTHMTA